MAPRTTTSRRSKAALSRTAAASDTGLTLYKGAAPLPEHRPVGTSSLVVADTFGGSVKRPIEASPVEVVNTFRDPEARPIMADSFQVVRTENICGNRPIGSSTMPVSRIDSAYGARPVGPNEVDEAPVILMGYLD